MTKKKKPNQKLQVWIDARKRHRLSHIQVQMARELGMNPTKLGKLDNHDQEPWKLPVAQHRNSLLNEGRPLICSNVIRSSARPAGRRRPTYSKEIDA